LVALELRSGRLIRQWRDEMSREPPYSTGPDSLFIAYYASAELGCHLALGWPQPARVLDLFVEFRNLTNGLPTPSGAGLLGALTYFGLDAMAAVEKGEMRELIMRGEPWSADERAAILDYCESDVRGLKRLLPHMAAAVDLPHALLRGRYMPAAADDLDNALGLPASGTVPEKLGFPTGPDGPFRGLSVLPNTRLVCGIPNGFDDFTLLAGSRFGGSIPPASTA